MNSLPVDILFSKFLLTREDMYTFSQLSKHFLAILRENVLRYDWLDRCYIVHYEGSDWSVETSGLYKTIGLCELNHRGRGITLTSPGDDVPQSPKSIMEAFFQPPSGSDAPEDRQLHPSSSRKYYVTGQWRFGDISRDEVFNIAKRVIAKLLELRGAGSRRIIM